MKINCPDCMSEFYVTVSHHRSPGIPVGAITSKSTKLVNEVREFLDRVEPGKVGREALYRLYVETAAREGLAIPSRPVFTRAVNTLNIPQWRLADGRGWWIAADAHHATQVTEPRLRDEEPAEPERPPLTSSGEPWPELF